MYKGFTLIELLVTLAVIGICVVLVAASAAPDDRTRVQVEGERLAQLLDLAATQARLTATPIRWSAGRSGYNFLRYTEDAGWSALPDGVLARARVFPDGVHVSDVRLDNTRRAGAPQLVFSPHAPAPVFSIGLSAGSARCRIVGSALGEVTLERERGDLHGSFAAR
jgi:general secretion pathway protein H